MPIYKMEGKKDGKQKYRVFINYTDSAGHYRKKSKIVYGADEAKYCEYLMSAEVNTSAPDSSVTLRQLFVQYMETKKHEVRQSTFEKTGRVLNGYIISALGDEKLNRLTSKKLQSWKNNIAGAELKIRTKQNIYKEFHALLNYAVKLDYISKNPLNALGNFKEVYFERPQDSLHYYTPEQFKQFISVAKDSIKSLGDYGCYVFFNIAFYTGMRKGEINALKWSDIDAQNIIHVRRSVSQKIKGESCTETPPKNKASYRSLQMPEPLIEILAEYKEKCKKMKGFTDDYRICGGVSCLGDTMLSNKNIQYANEAGLPHIRIHDFRHTHATLLVNEGINIQEIARRLGHSDIKMTWNTYAHLYPREEERAVKVLNKIK